jgi:hypothetical protein
MASKVFRWHEKRDNTVVEIDRATGMSRVYPGPQPTAEERRKHWESIGGNRLKEASSWVFEDNWEWPDHGSKAPVVEQPVVEWEAPEVFNVKP